MSEPSPPRRRFVPQPVETTTKSVRRSPVEPAETTTKSSKAVDDAEKKEEMAQGKSTIKRRFLPQPVETSIKSSRASALKPAIEPTPLPTPDPSPRSPQTTFDKDSAQTTPRPRRKFAPQLIETTKRSKKAGDPKPATLPTDKTDITPGTNHIYLPRVRKQPPPGAARLPSVPTNTPASGTILAHISPSAPRRQGSMRPHLNTRRSTRQDTFQPDLDDIMSSGSNTDEDMAEVDDEKTPSLSGSKNSSEDSLMRLQILRTRESCDDRFSGYLLELAAKAAEKQLREQALAAFPNSDLHHPVEHFYDREVSPSDDDDEDTIGVGLLPHERLDPVIRRKSTEVGWAAREMQQHQEHLARLREEETHRLIAAEATKPTFKDPFWTNGMTQKMAGIGLAAADKQKAAELASMHSAASPPMLGSDLKFRMCPSPKATKFETDQKPHLAMPTRKNDGGGLWGGYCVADDESQYLSPAARGPPMLQTPANECEDPFSSSVADYASGSPSKRQKSRPGSPDSRQGGVHMLSGITERLQAEVVKAKAAEALLSEFDDKFVTQVYNYLSLGYPSLARQYDEELSKITKVPQEELQKADRGSNVKGHIALAVENDVRGHQCTRWVALRLYIQEWARQNPGMDGQAAGPQAWGVRARRGSWAI